MTLTTLLRPSGGAPPGAGLECVIRSGVRVRATLDGLPGVMATRIGVGDRVRAVLTVPAWARAAHEMAGHVPHLVVGPSAGDRDDDAASNRVLGALVQGMAAPFARLHATAHGDATVPPWGVLTDPAVAPLWALPFAAQFTGGVMPTRLAGEADSDYLARARGAVVWPRGMRRGGVEAIRLAVEPTLTGARSVLIRERVNGDPWAMIVDTLAGETPDPPVTRRAAEAVAAAGVVVTVRALGGQTYDDLAARHATYDDVDAAYARYDDLASTAP